MKKDFISLLRVSLGLVLLFTGIVGILLPILQGWLLILVAIPLISPEHGKKMVAKLKEWGLKAKRSWQKRNI
ncbi:MAG: hypothetical protein AAB606_05260 [Patescibacteria group bacterium]